MTRPYSRFKTRSTWLASEQVHSNALLYTNSINPSSATLFWNFLHWNPWVISFDWAFRLMFVIAPYVTAVSGIGISKTKTQLRANAIDLGWVKGTPVRGNYCCNFIFRCCSFMFWCLSPPPHKREVTPILHFTQFSMLVSNHFFFSITISSFTR